MSQLDDRLKKEIAKILIEIGTDTLAEVLAQLADEATNEHDERMWLQSFGILTDGKMPLQHKKDDD